MDPTFPFAALACLAACSWPAQPCDVCDCPQDSDAADTERNAPRDTDADADTDADTDADADHGWICDVSQRNGSEVCDDSSFQVPDPYVPLAIVCLNDGGGVAYVSTNTGPVMDDGVARCQGWEQNGMNAWDYLDYIDQFTCDNVGDVLEVDLSPWTGQTLWVGCHDLPTGGGHMTEACLAHWE